MNGGQIRGTLAQGFHVPSVIFTAIFRIPLYHYHFDVSSPKGRRDNKTHQNVVNIRLLLHVKSF